jgi:hypothetical protein
MAKYSFDFNLQAWIQGVEIEADSYEEAESKLYKMTVEELIEAGYIHTSDVEDVDVEILESDYKVRVFDIEWEDEETAELLELLPKSVKEMIIKDIDVSDEYDNIKREIQDQLEIQYDRDVIYFDFEIIENLSSGENGEGER